MNAEARGRVLVASNRGPVSFRLSDDGRLTSRRGGGGMVSGLSSVAGGISEALVVTALGLLVAIPAVLIYNRLAGMAERIEQELGSAAGQFLDAIEFADARRAD